MKTAKSAIGGAQGFLHQIKHESALPFPVQAGESANGEHEHFHLQGDFRFPVADGACLPVQGDPVGPAAALMPCSRDNGINMLVGLGEVQILAGEKAGFLVVPRSAGELSAGKGDFRAVGQAERHTFPSPLGRAVNHAVSP